MTNILSYFKKPDYFIIGSVVMLILMMILSLFAFVITPKTSYAQVLTRQLELGMRGDDVSALQTFLAKDPSLYPQGLVTGYFGTLTKAAVSNFQSRNGISNVGRVGPITLPVLNAQMAAGGVAGSAGQAPAITSVSVSTSSVGATVNWNTNEYAKGIVYYSTNPLTMYERENSVDVSGNTAMTDAAFRTSQNVSITGLQPNTTYYYLIYTTNQAGYVSITWPNTFRTAN